MNIRKHAIVKGRVQGVGFRYFVKTNAEKLGLTGWVKNLPNGAVELEMQGQSSVIENMESLLARGPSFSHVDELLINDYPLKDEERDFEIRH